jgi:hypothetical protein
MKTIRNVIERQTDRAEPRAALCVWIARVNKFMFLSDFLKFNGPSEF